MSSSEQFLLGKHETSILLKPLFLAITAIIFFMFLLFKWPSPHSKKIFPPSPRKLPIMGNLHQLGLHPYRSLAALAQRYGPFMLLHFGRVPVLVVSSADAAAEILKTHDLVFATRPKSIATEKLLYGSKDMAMAPYGEYWRQMRSLCVLHLLNNKRVQSFSDIRAEEIALMVDRIEQFSLSSLPINLSETLFTLTNNVLSRVVFGRKCSDELEDEENNRLLELLGKTVELLGVFNVSDCIPWLAWVNYFNGLSAQLNKVARGLDGFLEKLVEEHEDRLAGGDTGLQGDDVKDFVDVLLSIQKQNTIGFPIDRTSIKAVILDMFGGGSETTYALLEWTMAELLRHPGVMNQVQNEVRTILRNKSDITEEDLNQMHYLKAIINETLRLYPPAPLLVPREATQDINIKGYDIAAGTRVIVNAWKIGRDPDWWDRAEEFWPERFLHSTVNYNKHDFRMIPFGAGRRGCPGIEFSRAVYEPILASLLNKFDWKLPGGAREEDLDMSESTGLSMRRKFPLIAVATPCSC